MHSEQEPSTSFSSEDHFYGLEDGCVDVNEIMAMFGDWTLRLDVQRCRFASGLFGDLCAHFHSGLIGNGLLIGTIRKRMTVANVFLINLATSDLLLCITALPITPVLAFVKRWIFGNVMCKLVPLCQGISVLISSYCLCLIAVDRYRSIVTPLKVPWSVNQAQTFMVFCWMGSVTISSPLFLTQRLQQIVLGNTTLCGEFCGEYDWPQDTRVKLAYGSALLIVQYLIPASIMTFCYWKILQKVRQDWIVSTGSMLTEAQQAQTSIRKRRVMDIGVGFLDIQMYFKLLNVHAIAMTSIVSNPLFIFLDEQGRRNSTVGKIGNR
uniref:G-protein coupled receptors family 1 profile domain-containing protein n=1 Tax=Ditylenchus dipsaci TaxID=166011 RepID=A0A915EIA7_9BILA